MCGGDVDWPVLDVREWKKARKEHECCACDTPIRRGDMYHLTTSIQDRGDKPSRLKHCARCWEICNQLWKRTDGEGIDMELNCGEDWIDNFGPLPDDIAALAFMTSDEMQQKLVPESAR